MTIAVGSDHAGFEFKQALVAFLQEAGHDVISLGAPDTESYDYPIAADAVSKAVLAEEASRGVLICGTGIGVSIRANRYHGIRAAVVCSEETARLARQHNHANVLCLGARTMTIDSAKQCLRVFLETGEDSNERHDRRVRELDGYIP